MVWENGRASADPQIRASGKEQKVASGERINGPQELDDVWWEFLAEKFAPTDKERLRDEFDKLPENEDVEQELTKKEFEDVVQRMRKAKATGPDNIPAEVWQNSKVAQEALFEFLQQVWKKEQVPEELTGAKYIRYDL